MDDLCGHIIRTQRYVWVCFLPRDNHPTIHPGIEDKPGRDIPLSHRMQVRYGPEPGIPDE